MDIGVYVGMRTPSNSPLEVLVQVVHTVCPIESTRDSVSQYVL